MLLGCPGESLHATHFPNSSPHPLSNRWSFVGDVRSLQLFSIVGLTAGTGMCILFRARTYAAFTNDFLVHSAHLIGAAKPARQWHWGMP